MNIYALLDCLYPNLDLCACVFVSVRIMWVQVSFTVHKSCATEKIKSHKSKLF